MSDDSKLVLMVAGLGIAAFILARRSTGTPPQSDIDHVARTIWAETSMLGGSESEFEAIGQVAVNRANIHNNGNLGTTLTPPGSPLWNSSHIYSDRWHDASSQPRFDRAQGVARRVLDGTAPNIIGSRMQFVHPRGLPRCGSDGECRGRRMCVNGRCLPIWSIAKRDGGNAPNEPIRIGRAIVS